MRRSLVAVAAAVLRPSVPPVRHFILRTGSPRSCNRGVRVGKQPRRVEPVERGGVRLCYVVVLASGGGKEGRSLSCVCCVARSLTGFVRRNCIVRGGIRAGPIRAAASAHEHYG